MARQGNHPLSDDQVRELVGSIEVLLAKIAAGELGSTAGMLARLEGAATALHQVLGEPVALPLNTNPSLRVNYSHGEAQTAAGERPDGGRRVRPSKHE